MRRERREEEVGTGISWRFRVAILICFRVCYGVGMDDWFD